MALQAEFEKSREEQIAKMAMGDIIPFLSKNLPKRLNMMRVQYGMKDGPEGVIVGWIREDRLVVRFTKEASEHIGSHYRYTSYQARSELGRSGTDSSWYNACLLEEPERKEFIYTVMDSKELMGIKEDPKPATKPKGIPPGTHLARARVTTERFGFGTIVGRNSNNNGVLVLLDVHNNHHMTKVGAMDILKALNWVNWLKASDQADHHYALFDCAALALAETAVKEEPKPTTPPPVKSECDLSDDLQIVRERLYANYGISPVMKFAEIHMRLLKEMRVYEGGSEHCRLCGAHKGGEQHSASCAFIGAFDIEADKVKAEMAKEARKRVPQTRDAFLETFTRRMPPMKKVEFCQRLIPLIEE